MNEIIKETIFRLTGLPASAVVTHALLEYDLGVDQTKMEILIGKLDKTFALQTGRHIWSGFQRVGDINDYLKHQLKEKDLHFSTNYTIEPSHDH
ncbi:MAG TPA: hypothetical protein VGN64_04980 [Dyadobacter sp.]|jgi:hypothetical protein|nr:hypothetical protein [Dyadobacter sp.]